ncbi:Phosphoglucomutase [Aphelenchoides fujianensis]|nr:Phosphoglucomutase [Aphelenchoides fujianensis]
MKSTAKWSKKALDGAQRNAAAASVYERSVQRPLARSLPTGRGNCWSEPTAVDPGNDATGEAAVASANETAAGSLLAPAAGTPIVHQPLSSVEQSATSVDSPAASVHSPLTSADQPSTSAEQPPPPAETAPRTPTASTARAQSADNVDFHVTTVTTKPFDGQKPGTSGLLKRVSEFQQEHYTENFVQCVLDGGLGAEKKGAVLVVGGDGRFLCPQVVNVCIKIAAANGLRKLIVAKDGLLSTPALSRLIRSKKYNDGQKIHGGIILTASHNPGGPKNDFGIKFNCENGGPAPDAVTTKIFELSKTIKEYRICHELNIDFGQIGTTTVGINNVGQFTVQVIDGIDPYVEYMEEIFDFMEIKRFLAGDFTDGRPFKVLADSMHGVTGPYVSTILVDKLGLDASACLRTAPKPDFGGGHPDPNLTYAKDLVDQLARGEHDFGVAFDGDGDRNMILGKNGFFVTPSDSLAVIGANLECIPYFRQNGIHGKSPHSFLLLMPSTSGFARSMPTAAAIDLVARAQGLPCYEVPTGWKYFGNLMDAGKLSLCGEESFGTGSDHIREKDGVWAFLAWLQILAHRRSTVVDLIRAHWRTFGRNVFTRYDYYFAAHELFNVGKMMTHLAGVVPVGKEVAVGNEVFKIIKADNFEYTDPTDATTENPAVRFDFGGGARIAFVRLNEVGSAGVTIRIYVENFVNSDDPELETPAQDILRPLILVALQICKLEQFTGRTLPTVIT